MQWVGNHINDGLRSRLTCSGVRAAREELPNDRPDHLGSSSFITDAIGYATQHLQYLPFGETFVDQKAGSFDSRYKFSAKEKDDETGYSYFGARYYDADLSVWLSVDNYTALASNWSPYNYVFGNPVMLTDPDGNFPGGGDKVHIKHGRKVKRQNSPPTNRNRNGQKYGSGVGYRATDIYNSVTGDNSAHKVRSGRFVTSPWTQVPQTSQNGNWTSHRFSGPQYNPDDYRLRNTRLSVVSNDQWNVFALLSGNGIPINYGAGHLNPDFSGAYNYNNDGAIFGMLNALAWLNANFMLGPSSALLGPNNGIIIPVLVELINSAMVNPVFSRTNTFRAYSNNSVGGTSHTVWIRYRVWQSNYIPNMIRQIIRRFFYGQMRIQVN